MPSRSVFDGRSLTLYRSDGSIVGSWPAISGRNGDQQPSNQNLPFKGPLTEGQYSFSTGNIQPITTLEAAKGLVFRGRFPGSMAAWGTERAELVPNSTSTNGRNHFFIHGGFTPGSAGCIDLGPNEKAYFDAVRSTGEASHDVIVSYDPSLETSPHPLAGRHFWDGAGEYLTRPMPSPVASSPEQRALPATPAVPFVDRFEKWGTSPRGVVSQPGPGDPASLDQRFGNWASTYAGGRSASNLPPMVPPGYVGPGMPFVSAPAGSLVAPGGSSLIDPAPMNPGTPGPFSTGGRFVPRSPPPQPLYPAGALVPASNGRLQDRQASLDDRSGNRGLRMEDADSYRSPVLRELQRYRQLAASGIAAAASSTASNPGIPLASSAAGNGAGDPWGGVLKLMGSGLINSAAASQPNLLSRGDAATGFVGENDGPISNASEAASLLAPDNRRYLSRRTASQASAFDTEAPTVPFIPTNEGLSLDRPNSFDDRFGNWPSAPDVTQPALPQQASRLLGLFSGQPMLDWPVPPPIFVLPDRPNAPDNDEWFKFIAGLAR